LKQLARRFDAILRAVVINVLDYDGMIRQVVQLHLFSKGANMVVSRVKKIMEERGVTIRAMAERTQMSDATILRARREILQCRMSTLEIIANCLKCQIKDLFDENKSDFTDS
jgi:DNA-binding Xre family transcriptional regulator